MLTMDIILLLSIDEILLFMKGRIRFSTLRTHIIRYLLPFLLHYTFCYTFVNIMPVYAFANNRVINFTNFRVILFGYNGSSFLRNTSFQPLPTTSLVYLHNFNFVWHQMRIMRKCSVEWWKAHAALYEQVLNWRLWRWVLENYRCIQVLLQLDFVHDWIIYF